MTNKTICWLIAYSLMLPIIAGAVTEKDFTAQTTEQIINLCTTSPDDPMYLQAINFCHGYLVGAYHYHEAAKAGPGGIELFCPPDPMPSRNQSIKMFIEWAKSHPQYWNEPPVETEFRFLMEKWPCKE